MNETARWAPIPGYGGRYEVSEIGGLRRSDGRHMKSWADGRPGNRYLRVYLSLNGVRKGHRVHTLVAAAFLGPRPVGMSLVRHLNGDPFDNRVENLAYGTYSDNLEDSVAHGTHAMSSKTHCKRGHEFTPENTYIDGHQARQCRMCRRIRDRRRVRPSRARGAVRVRA